MRTQRFHLGGGGLDVLTCWLAALPLQVFVSAGGSKAITLGA
jgi:hypothetical protein